MRIAQITYSYQPVRGGADVYADLLRDVLTSAGHEVMTYQRPVEEIPSDRARPIPNPFAKLIGKRGEFWTLPFGLTALKKELLQYDVLIAHYPNYHRFIEWHPRTILLSHGVFWDDRPNALRSQIKRALARRAYRKASAVVANDTFFLREVGEDVAPGAEAFSQVRPNRYFAPNCVDTAFFTPCEPYPQMPKTPFILVPRNLYRNRGVHLAIQSFALCHEELGDVRLVIVGGVGQPGYQEYCEDLAKNLGVAEYVDFAGAIPWVQMPAVYSAAKLTLIPTLCGEGTSLSALEAMSCGCATVTTDVAGLADLPAEKAAVNPEALAAAMLSTWQDSEEIAAGQQTIIRQDFTLQRWQHFWVQLIEKLTK